MAHYRVPQRELRFILNDVLGFARLSELPVFADATPDILDGVIDEAARFTEERLLPLRTIGDTEGCKLADGTVKTPPGFTEAYREYQEAGWVGLATDPEWGGQGLPYTLGKVVEEMVCAANVAFALYPGLTIGCFEALLAHASEEQKQTYLPKLGSGEWTGTMCLTEPQAGSDLGAVKTRAERLDNGNYKLNGMKIFISSGEHEMADNIIHYVLARATDSPDGVKGLSTFIVPKYKVNADGSLGERNGVKVQAIQHKMGLHGSCTCVMVFDDAEGYLVGEPNRGIMNMFTMMNLARIMVGFQGLGQAELALQSSQNYARERIQGRTLTGGSGPIADHPDVRRMLLKMRALTEGARAMAYDIAMQVDFAHGSEDPAQREAAQDWVDLFTPVVKAFCTGLGVESGLDAVQVYGGHGFIAEHGVEQIVRDAKILCLYEGTNGIQAMDLVRRKLQLKGGALVEQFYAKVEQALADAPDERAFLVEPLTQALAELRQTTTWLRERFNSNPNDAGAGAVEYQRAFALVALGYYWLRMLDAATGHPDADFRAAKAATARFFARRVLPEAGALLTQVRAGSDEMMDISIDALCAA